MHAVYDTAAQCEACSHTHIDSVGTHLYLWSFSWARRWIRGDSIRKYTSPLLLKNQWFIKFRRDNYICVRLDLMKFEAYQKINSLESWALCSGHKVCRECFVCICVCVCVPLCEPCHTEQNSLEIFCNERSLRNSRDKRNAAIYWIVCLQCCYMSSHSSRSFIELRLPKKNTRSSTLYSVTRMYVRGRCHFPMKNFM